MVMPCSRSASRPSVSRDRSISSCPRFHEARCTAASWSSKIARVSCSSRPISVLLPSSTLPAVMKRSTPRWNASTEATPPGAVRAMLIPPSFGMLEITFLLAALHGGFRGLVVHAGGAALGDGRQGRLGDDLGGGGGSRFHRAGAGDVAHGAESH